MGKRKSRKAPQKKIAQKVPKVFDCPFCNHEKSVECKLDHKLALGVVRCRVCAADYQTRITYLMEPVDVYADWIDECDKINKTDPDVSAVQDDDDDGEQGYDDAPPVQRRDNYRASAHDDDDDDEDDDDE
jgi:transcription elongation factor Elf1